jgi:hypothetical protein
LLIRRFISNPAFVLSYFRLCFLYFNAGNAI